MANNRKVQADIDRLLKKTQEGLDVYEEMYAKFKSAPNASAKERIEADLKREIKKLQRHRDNIKGFIANPDVKDTKQLEDYRAKIESKMEAFKLCEREMKTKAFSKEGLAAAPADSAESATLQWLKGAIDEGHKKLELLDYEVQKANNSRSRKAKSAQKSDAQTKLEHMQTHFYNWEALLRMLNNEEISDEEVDMIKENVDKLLTDDADLDTVADMTIYDGFDIPEQRVKPSSSAVVEEAVSSPSDSAKAKAKAAPSPKSTTSVHEEVKSPAKEVPPPKPQPALLPDDLGEEEEPIPEWMEDADDLNADTFGDDAVMGGAAIGSLAEMAAATGAKREEFEKARQMAQENSISGLQEVAVPPAAVKSPTPNVWEKRAEQSRLQQQQLVAAALEAADTKASPTGESSEAPAAAEPSAPSLAPGGGRSRREVPKRTIAQTHALLEMSLANLPHTHDVERQRPYEPPNAIEPIPRFPTEVLPALSNKTIYQHMDVDTLFFIFYYHQKSYQQYFAAKQLKAHSYRYHTEQKRWYQRLERPVEATDTEERGSYTFFDFEDKWAHDRVDNFCFEYKFLESDLQ